MQQKFDMNPKWKNVRPIGFYVYIHVRYSDMKPFYAGVGSAKRAWNIAGRSKRWLDTARKHGFFIHIVKDGMTRDESFDLEIETISMLRSRGFPMVNISDGGLCDLLFSHRTEESLKKIGKALSRPVYCSDGRVFNSCKDAAMHMVSEGHAKASPSGIVYGMDSESRTIYGYSWSRHSTPAVPSHTGKDALGKHSKKPVCCDELGHFDSAADAAKHLVSMGILNAKQHSITNCCGGRQHSAYGYKWRKVDGTQSA